MRGDNRTPEVKAKLAKHFLKMKAAACKKAACAGVPALKDTAEVTTTVVASEASTTEVYKKGEVVRVCDEALGKNAFGIICEIISSEGESYLLRAQEKGSHKFGKNFNVNAAQVEIMTSLKPPEPWKKMQLNYDLRVELDLQFPAEELETAGSLKVDSRCAAMHIDMAWWLIKRDLQITSESKIAYLRPDAAAALFYDLMQADAAESFCQACAKVKGEIADAETILCPIWGGFQDGCQRWTLLTVVKSSTGQWATRYRDSLFTGPDSDCKQAAQKILTLLSTALHKDLKFPTELYN